MFSPNVGLTLISCVRVNGKFSDTKANNKQRCNSFIVLPNTVENAVNAVRTCSLKINPTKIVWNSWLLVNKTVENDVNVWSYYFTEKLPPYIWQYSKIVRLEEKNDYLIKSSDCLFFSNVFKI